MKELFWEGSSLRDLHSFTKLAKRLIGHELMRVQAGVEPQDWKPMTTVGQGVREIRVHLENEYRVLYVTKIKDSVHVLHAFTKKTQKTSKSDIEIAQKRYQQLMRDHLLTR